MSPSGYLPGDPDYLALKAHFDRVLADALAFVTWPRACEVQGLAAGDEPDDYRHRPGWCYRCGACGRSWPVTAAEAPAQVGSRAALCCGSPVVCFYGGGLELPRLGDAPATG
jgi:hypothetical protein